MGHSPPEHARRALTLIGLAVVAVLVAGAVYLRPLLAAHGGLGAALFVDADHGAVSVPGDSPGNAAVYLTRDGGRTWRTHAGGSASAIVSAPGAGPLVVGRLGAEDAVHVSGDGRRTWRSLPAPGLAGGGAGIAATARVLLRSRDGGAHWEEVQQPPRPSG